MPTRIDHFGIATLILAGVVTACQPQAVPGSASIGPGADGGSAAAGTPEASPSIRAGGWMAYQNEPGGFALEIPAGWVVQETIEVGSVLVSFSAPGGGTAMTVQVPGSAGGGPSDLPNVRCQEIMVGGLPAVRCRDTVSGGDVTSVAAPDRTYAITNLGKGTGDVYEHMLGTFVILEPR